MNLLGVSWDQLWRIRGATLFDVKENSAEQSDLKCALLLVFLLVNQRTASFTAGSTHTL